MLFGLIFGGAGILMLIIAASLGIGIAAAKHDKIPVSAIVRDIEFVQTSSESTARYYKIEYTAPDGEKYSTYYTSANNYNISDKITVYLDKGEYSVFTETTPQWVILMLVIMGGAFFGVGLSSIIPEFKRFLNKRLNTTGVPLDIICTYSGESNVRINDRITYIVKGEWESAEGKVYKFKTPLLRKMPAIAEGSKLTVMVDASNYKRYYFPIDESWYIEWDKMGGLPFR